MSTEQSIDPRSVEETKQQIRSLISEIAQLSRTNCEPQVYYSEFLQRILSALAAAGGAIWILKNQNELTLTYQIGLRQVFPEDQGAGLEQERHSALLYGMVRQGEPLLVPPYSGAGDDESAAGNPTGYLLVLAPIRDDERVAGIIEIFQRPTSSPASQRGYLGFLSEMAQHFSQYLKSRRLRELSDWQSTLSEVDRFAQIVHETLDPTETAYTIANEGRRLIGCDRVSVAVKKGRKCIVQAVSGQDTMDTRSNAVVLLSKLATAVVRSGEPLWYTGSSDDLPPQIEEAVHNYVDETHTKTVAVLPLKRIEEDQTDLDDARRTRLREEEKVVGALIVEQIEDSRPKHDFARPVELVVKHSSRALANAVEHHNVFLMPTLKRISRLKWLIQARTLPKTLAVAGAVLATIAFLCFYPYEFKMKAKGKIRPVERREVFADIDGTVNVVHVKHGQNVTKGQLLVELENPQLTTEYARIEGELLEEVRRYETFQRQLSNPQSMEPSERTQLTIEALRSKQRIQTLEEQKKLRQIEIDALKIYSPMEGQVITWDVEDLLLLRPVTRGNLLMTVANPEGEWELELYMEEDRMGHLRRAMAKKKGEPMKVTYFLASDPKAKFEGQLHPEGIHDLAQLHDEFGHSVRLQVNVNRDDVKDALPGTEATGKVHCGWTSFGYAWFHELIEFLQAKVFF